MSDIPLKTPGLSSPAPFSALKRMLPLVGVAVFAAAIWLLDRELGGQHLTEAVAYARKLPPSALLLAAVYTLLSYVALTGYDFLAVRYAGAVLPAPTVLKTAFTASAVGHSLGFAALTGGSIRYRFYTAAGLSGFQITTAVTFLALSFPLSITFLGGFALLAQPEIVAQYLMAPEILARLIGVALALPMSVLLAASALGFRQLPVGRWRVRLPTFANAAGQAVAGSLDLLLAAATLYILLPADSLPFATFLGLYLAALLVASLSQVPGGLGVFEGLIVSLTAPYVEAQVVLGALLAYRMVYYVGPLLLAILWFGAGEFNARRHNISALAQFAGRQWAAVAPLLSAAAVFVAGATLVITGAAPEGRTAISLVNDWLPLGVIEGSHLIASVVGVGLTLLAFALLQRVDAAYFATLALLGVGVVTSLTRGFHYQEALALAAVAAALWPARSAFYRQAALTGIHLSGQWLIAVAVVIAGSIWLGFFAHRHVEYSSELWWQFELNGNAPRFLRASLLVILLFTAVSARQLLMPRVRMPSPPTSQEIERAAAAVASAPDSSANLALMGDKALLFDQAGDGFIMYRVQGGTWVAMGDPVAPAHRQASLLWQFREMIDEYGGRCVFYQVKPENLSLYADLGLALYKMGDEARVDLAGFSLDSPARRDLRQTHRRAAREGTTFRLLSPAEVRNCIPRLRQVSDAWLAHKGGREKGFSLGFFDDDYIARFPCGVVEAGGEIIAFANLWPGAGKTELSIDLMRHVDTKLYGVMDFLLVEIMLWGKAQGYQWFNLGMAPLSGLESRRLGPLWHKVGGLVYRMGDQFYSFRGLRRYKEKFGPVWRPKYLACPGGLAIGRVIIDITAAIAGAPKSVRIDKTTA
ncbi:MAG: bifunctional lysylphosphatidylglycerol flippase/synthetase MprF [Rhodospirillaceae bacterium]|nr:bifunctional lysylphosphatidylglycerol flippase/synthetase MprF [Rhodospirillaceae bacterium]